MLPIQWKVEAQEDLTAILTYIAQHNQPAALQLYNDIDNAIPGFPATLTYTCLEEFQARVNWLPIQTMSSYIALKRARLKFLPSCIHGSYIPEQQSSLPYETPLLTRRRRPGWQRKQWQFRHSYTPRPLTLRVPK